jgi:hypothetical protein
MPRALPFSNKQDKYVIWLTTAARIGVEHIDSYHQLNVMAPFSLLNQGGHLPPSSGLFAW